MHRRALLAAVGTGATALAGCARLGSDPTALSVLERERDGETAFYDLGVDDSFVQSVDVLAGRRRDPDAPDRVAVSVTPAEGYRTTAIRLAVRAPAGDRPGAAPATVAAEAPEASVPRLTVRRDDEGVAVVQADELAEIGENTLQVAVRVHPRSPVEAADIRVRTQVRGDGEQYVATLQERRSMLTE